MKNNPIQPISKVFKNVLNLLLLSILFPYLLSAQSATIHEETQMIKTYSFDAPNSVPILSDNPKIYPYFKFEGYEHNAKNKAWKVVTLENKYIKLFVLPEIGGKIWGAIEKKTGEEFIYKNEVIKFRDIAMRGPWTSGGVEFNFGIIGHSPATATPVDYLLKENEDGSVSCIVGTIDLPSRTQWRVEITLQKDKAYFETKASWYNPTPINQSYYNWMTAAAAAKNDLEFFTPGNQYLEHNGNVQLWPIDKQGRELSFYKNNNFGLHKSYHVVGNYKDFFGGYYHQSKFGFGHWANYEEMPGQKLWLWALSRSGGVWEDLLTDTDGQYIEFQAGRLFNQYFPGKENNPITQANFEPNVMDRWREIWFPYKEIGGMVDASEYGVLNVEQEKNKTYIGVCALQELNENIKVQVNGVDVINEKLKLQPMGILSKNIPTQLTDTIEVFIGEGKLHYTTNQDETLLKRSFSSDSNLKISQSQKLFTDGWDAMKYREYDKALEKLSELNMLDPSHQTALVKLAELEYRRTNYDTALEYANAALKMDTYNPEANYKTGIIYRAQKDFINALEAFGWAARDTKYRSVSYAQMAEIFLSLNNNVRAKEYAFKALDFNTYNLNARQVLIIISRKQKDVEAFKTELKKLLSMDPLNHFAAFEANLIIDDFQKKSIKIPNIQNEFKEETILELALQYQNMGLIEETIMILMRAPKNVKIKLWLAYLFKKSDIKKSQRFLEEAVNIPSNFVSPYRRETIPVLEWTLTQKPHWKLKYYLAQNYIAVSLNDRGKQFLKDCNNEPNSESFYKFRAKMLANENYKIRLQDYQKALQLNNQDWTTWNEIIQFNLENKNYNEAHKMGHKAFKNFPNNYNIALSYAKTLLLVKKYSESIQVLKNLTVLPSESTLESREIYYNAHVFLGNQYIQEKKYKKAIQVLNASKNWSENLGIGKPYNVDDRLQNFLLSTCFEKLKEDGKRKEVLNSIIAYTYDNMEHSDVNHLFGLLSLKINGKDTEASQLLLKLEGITQKDDLKTRLALALFKKDKKELLAIKDKNIISENLWNILENVSF